MPSVKVDNCGKAFLLMKYFLLKVIAGNYVKVIVDGEALQEGLDERARGGVEAVGRRLLAHAGHPLVGRILHHHLTQRVDSVETLL